MQILSIMSGECPDTVKSTKKCEESGLRLGSRCDMIWLVWGGIRGPVTTIIILCRAPAIASDVELAYGRMGHHTTPTGARTRAGEQFGLIKPLFGMLIRLGALGCSRPT